MIKWFLRLAVLAAVAGVLYLAMHRGTVIGRVEDATERVDDKLRGVERTVESAQEKKEDLQDAARDAKKKVL
jgi:hypothetical protein